MIILTVSGNLTANAILKTINGSEVINFTIASNRRFKTNAGEIREEVTFINCQLWDKADTLKYLYKGRPLSIAGSLAIRKYSDRNGNEQTALNCRVSFFQLFGKNAETGQLTTTTKIVENPTGEVNTEFNTYTVEPLPINEDLPF